jgi:NADH-quinone oxidoreductase subunit C
MSATDDANQLRNRLGAGVVETREFRGETTVVVTPAALHEALAACRREFGYEMLLDLSGVDHFGSEPRFEVVYELATVDDRKHLRVKAAVAEDQPVPTAVDLWGGAEWHEREVWDMMGIPFAGHPDLRRILMWEGYPYFPLRKDFPLAGLPSDMPDVAFSAAAPLEGGPFVACSASNTVQREPRSKEPAQ